MTGAVADGVATEVLAVPGTSIPLYACLILHRHAGTWVVSGILLAPLAAETSNAYGLRLPMHRFATYKLATTATTGGISHARIFITAKVVVVILWFAQQPNPLHGYSQFTLHPQQPAWQLHSATSDTIVYFDAGQEVLLTGNVSSPQLLALAQSIPSALAPNFPYPNLP